METPIEKIPNVQKRLIRKANALGKPVITATQMLRSMVDHTQPTRAEVTDVVNAIYDGSDAVMLSEETASGQFPVEAFQMMAKIAQSAEEEFPHPLFLRKETDEGMNLQQAITYAASLLAEEVRAAGDRHAHGIRKYGTMGFEASASPAHSRLEPTPFDGQKTQSLLGSLSCSCPRLEGYG